MAVNRIEEFISAIANISDEIQKLCESELKYLRSELALTGSISLLQKHQAVS